MTEPVRADAVLERLSKSELLYVIRSLECSADWTYVAARARRASLMARADTAWQQYLALSRQMETEFPAGIPDDLDRAMTYFEVSDTKHAAAERYFRLAERADGAITL